MERYLSRSERIMLLVEDQIKENDIEGPITPAIATPVLTEPDSWQSTGDLTTLSPVKSGRDFLDIQQEFEETDKLEGLITSISAQSNDNITTLSALESDRCSLASQLESVEFDKNAEKTIFPVSEDTHYDRELTTGLISSELLGEGGYPLGTTNENHEKSEPKSQVGDAYTGRPRKGRKRKYPNQNRTIRKMKCIRNETYITRRGKVKDPKEFREYLCPCKCLSKLGIERARKEFQKFYDTDSHDAQTALICAMVSEHEIKRKRVKDSKKKTVTRRYNICGVLVCKTFFLQTFRISSGKVHLALKKIQSPTGVRDQRGIGGGKNKLPQYKKQEVIDHIMKFPKYKSHYRREETNREFLAPDMTIDKMYNLYSEEHENPVSLSSYKKIFLTEFNLQRKSLKKDTCNICDTLEVQIKNSSGCERQNYDIKKTQHLKNAKLVQDLKSSDMLKSKFNDKLETLCFDLEKTLPLPRIPTNLVFYKRQLWLYNLGIHSGTDDKGHCYVWLEGEAGRGAQEVGSCLYKHLMENVLVAKEVILWSDSCGGQNRNIKIVLILKAVLEKHPTIEKITERFLLPGHSFLPNDSDFGDIERALKLQQRLYTAEDYINVMQKCRKKNPLVIHRMTNADFYSTAVLEKKIVNRKTGTNNERINWLHVREIELRKSQPHVIFFKTQFDAQHIEVNIKKSTAGRRHQNGDATNFYSLQIPLWPNGKCISQAKLDDLRSLMKLIPNDAKTFYKRLCGNPEIQDDVDGFDCENIDFDLENA